MQKYSSIKKTTFLLTFFIFAISTNIAFCQELSPQKINEIEKLISQKMSEERIPGLSVAIVMDGELIWSNGYGMADLENFVPAKSATAYRSASIGKSITAAAVMQLVKNGIIDLDTPIQSYCPTFPEKRWTITTRHLLNHTSGIRHYGGEHHEKEMLSTVNYNDVIEPLDIFKNDTLLFKPGTQFSYSTYGYNVLGCIVVGASGMKFMDYLNNNIFIPSHMTNTYLDDPFKIIPNRSSGYQLNEESSLINAPYVDMSNKLPAGGFITTVEDLGRFAGAFMNYQIVSSSTVEQMLTPQKTDSGQIFEIGLGWGLFPGEDWYGEKEAFHGGITPGVSGMLYLLPGRKFAVAMQMNLQGVSGRTQLSADIAKLVLELN